MTIVWSTSLPGAEIMTLFAPALRCFEALSLSRKMPVDSMTISISKSFQGRVSGHLSLKTFISLPLTIIEFSVDEISASHIP